jgi:hypothetical protein
MNNSISIGTNARPVMVTADVYAHLLDGQGNAIENNITVRLGVEDLTLEVSESLLLSTTVADLMNCWLVTVAVPAGSKESLRLEQSMKAAVANLFFPATNARLRALAKHSTGV